jgi:hypothetical protein
MAAESTILRNEKLKLGYRANGMWQCPLCHYLQTKSYGKQCEMCLSRNPFDENQDVIIMCSSCGHQNLSSATFCALCENRPVCFSLPGSPLRVKHFRPNLNEFSASSFFLKSSDSSIVDQILISEPDWFSKIDETCTQRKKYVNWQHQHSEGESKEGHENVIQESKHGSPKYRRSVSPTPLHRHNRRSRSPSPYSRRSRSKTPPRRRSRSPTHEESKY